jgi:hypothetical protein
MAYTPLRGLLTAEQEAFLRDVPEDTEEAPRMVMGEGEGQARGR